MLKRIALSKLFCFLVLLLASPWVAAVESVSLQALFKDKAILEVDGKRRVLASGSESPEGVKLLATNTSDETAEIEIEGKRETLHLGVVIANFASKGKGSVILYPDRGGHFFVDGLVNGTNVRFMIDTGATVVAMNSIIARRIGIDYRKVGTPGMANTPGGVVRTYDIVLNNIQVGNVTLYNVAGSVIEGSYPRESLLGMSFLGQLDMKRDGQKMELSER